MIFCVSAGHVASAAADTDIKMLELLKENRISYAEFVKVANSQAKPQSNGTWSDMSVTDGTWSDMSVTNSTWSDMSVTEGTWSDMSVTDSTWSDMSVTGHVVSNPVNDRGQVPQPIISKGIDQ
jgi:hypothetical protein